MNTVDSYAYLKLLSLDRVIICPYVDDMLIFGTNVHVVNETKKSMYFILKQRTWKKLM